MMIFNKMKTAYTTGCEGVPEGATAFRNIGRSTKFIKQTGFKVEIWADGWIKCTDKDFSISSYKKIDPVSDTKKLFKFSGEPEVMLRHHIYGVILGLRKVIIYAYKGRDGLPVWVLPTKEVTRIQAKAERIGSEIEAISSRQYNRIAGIKVKLASTRPTITRTYNPAHSMTIQAG